MDPQQELFSALLVALRELNIDVYDGILPPEDVPYPFIYLGENQLIDRSYKDVIGGRVIQTVHVFHSNVRSRGDLSQILLSIKTTARKLHHSKNFDWYVSNVNQRILPDNTTDIPLLHGVLEIEFQFT